MGYDRGVRLAVGADGEPDLDAAELGRIEPDLEGFGARADLAAMAMPMSVTFVSSSEAGVAALADVAGAAADTGGVTIAI